MGVAPGLELRMEALAGLRMQGGGGAEAHRHWHLAVAETVPGGDSSWEPAKL